MFQSLPHILDVCGADGYAKASACRDRKETAYPNSPLLLFDGTDFLAVQCLVVEVMSACESDACEKASDHDGDGGPAPPD